MAKPQNSDAIEDGASIRLENLRAEHTHLGRALAQRLPRLRDGALPERVAALISRYLDGESLDDAARRADCQPIVGGCVKARIFGEQPS